MNKSAIEELMQFVMEKDDDTYGGVSYKIVNEVDEQIKSFKKHMGNNELLKSEYEELMQSVEKLCREYNKIVFEKALVFGLKLAKNE